MLIDRFIKKRKPSKHYQAIGNLRGDLPSFSSRSSGKRNLTTAAICLFIIIGITGGCGTPSRHQTIIDKQSEAPTSKGEEKRKDEFLNRGIDSLNQQMAEREKVAEPNQSVALTKTVDNKTNSNEALTEAVASKEKKDYIGSAKEMTIDLGGGVKMEFILVPAGEFTMGSPFLGKEHLGEGPSHRVKISKSFYIGKYAVTRGQFAAFVHGSRYKTDAETEGWIYTDQAEGLWKQVKGASWQNPGFSQDDNHPVVCINCDDVDLFCKWLSRREGKKCRLPTEAEWEYACRAGSTTRFYCGDDPNDPKLRDYIWCDENSNFKTHPVGQKKPNAFGIYDMCGNTMEWCQDWYDEEYYWNSPPIDPQGPSTGKYRVVRGGSWWSSTLKCSSSFRNRRMPDYRSDGLGFRVVIDL